MSATSCGTKLNSNKDASQCLILLKACSTFPSCLKLYSRAAGHVDTALYKSHIKTDILVKNKYTVSIFS